MKASPFLKWAGGKSQLLQKIEPFIPSYFNNYIEPFIGGGALFFYLASTERISKAILLDSNKELIDCYRAVKSHLKTLLLFLQNHKSEHYNQHEEYYYHVRNRQRNSLELWRRNTLSERAAMTIYLNKTCYNGLYRVNSNNEFNVPIGRYRAPEVYNIENLKADSRALKLAKMIKVSDFSASLQYAQKDDFIYFDPPYSPLSKTSNFTSYTKDGFGIDEQKRLAVLYDKLDRKNCKVMLSNSDTPLIRELYSQYKILSVKANRMINCNSKKRGRINELIITNY